MRRISVTLVALAWAAAAPLALAQDKATAKPLPAKQEAKAVVNKAEAKSAPTTTAAVTTMAATPTASPAATRPTSDARAAIAPKSYEGCHSKKMAEADL